jgi:hypothetical protein
MQTKHVLLIGGFMAATAAVLNGMHTWDEIFKPGVVGGLLGQMALVITAMYQERPNEAPK